MTRKEFLKICGILGVQLPLQASLLSACSAEDLVDPDFSGKVLIIGAGAGGLSAGYLLQQRGIDFEILEASAAYGGRMKINTDFADFPIPLGAEWLHADPSVFQSMVNDPATNVRVDTVRYDRPTDTLGLWENGRLTVSRLDDSDIKFVDYSWFNFYEEYIVPSIADRIRYRTVVTSIDYSGEEVVVQTSQGALSAARVIVGVPLKILQQGAIGFAPALPQKKAEAIARTPVWDGFKAFIEFSEKFYDTQILFPVRPAEAGQKLYYDAAYGQNTTRHILGLFAVGQPVAAYAALSGQALIDFMLGELDAIYDGQATRHYVGHIVQNWNDEPFIGAGYLSDHANWRDVRDLGEPVAGKLFFAGGEFTDGEDWVSVHVAAQSARDAVQAMLG